ncbi:MAG: hypothetical protein OHK0039_16810 [Bacteroidia bacterium]
MKQSILIGLLLCSGALAAQSVRVQGYFPAPTLTLPADTQRNAQPHAHITPAYVRANPAGHAWLCRQEVAIEQRMPVGIWFDTEGTPWLAPQLMGSAHLRLRVPLAGRR